MNQKKNIPTKLKQNNISEKVTQKKVTNPESDRPESNRVAKNKKNIREESAEESVTQSENNSNEQSNVDSSEIMDLSENESIGDAFEYDEKKSNNIVKQNKKESRENSESHMSELEKEAESEYVKEVVMDRIIKYIKIDDLIKKKDTEHKTEMKTIKESKTKLEKFIMAYLDKIEQEFVVLGKNNKLTKTIVETKGKITPESISDVLREEFKKRKICKEGELDPLVEEFIKNIEAKRTVTIKKELVRSDPAKEEIKEEKKIKKEKDAIDKANKSVHSENKSENTKKRGRPRKDVVKQDD